MKGLFPTNKKKSKQIALLLFLIIIMGTLNLFDGITQGVFAYNSVWFKVLIIMSLAWIGIGLHRKDIGS